MSFWNLKCTQIQSERCEIEGIGVMRMKECQIGVILLCLILIISFNNFLFSQPETLMVTVPVIPAASMLNPGTLDESTLLLKVNGIPRKISGFRRIERSLSSTTGHGKHFILSFVTGSTSM